VNIETTVYAALSRNDLYTAEMFVVSNVVPSLADVDVF
jgi:hypothetical protein